MQARTVRRECRFYIIEIRYHTNVICKVGSHQLNFYSVKLWRNQSNTVCCMYIISSFYNNHLFLKIILKIETFYKRAIIHYLRVVFTLKELSASLKTSYLNQIFPKSRSENLLAFIKALGNPKSHDNQKVFLPYIKLIKLIFFHFWCFEKRQIKKKNIKMCLFHMITFIKT